MLDWKPFQQFSEDTSSVSRSISTEFTLLLDYEYEVTIILQNVGVNLPVD
jgi:hypothetical protein